MIVVSGDTDYRQIQRFLETGALAYITKPFDARKLLETIDELINDQAQRP